jgi:hypothetical protein
MGPSGSTAIENCTPFFLMQDGRAKKIRWRANICKVVEQTFKKKCKAVEQKLNKKCKMAEQKNARRSRSCSFASAE